MRLTLQTDFALRVLIYCGVNTNGRTTIRDIAQSYQISENHLMKVVNKLTSLGYLTAIRGRTGGIKLAPSTIEVPLGELVRSLETDLTLVPCFIGEGGCVIRKVCLLKTAIDEATSAFFQSLDRRTFGDLLVDAAKVQKALHIASDPSVRGLEAG